LHQLLQEAEPPRVLGLRTSCRHSQRYSRRHQWRS
jgi:hypothetical protein